MKLATAIILLAAAGAAVAQTTYRWTDKDGKLHYTDRPPAPGEAAKVEQKRSALPGADPTLPYALRQALADHPVTLHTQPDCGPCQEGRTHLNHRGIPFGEKTVAGPADLAALRALTGQGDTLLPVLQVGRRSVRGFLAADWDSLLDAAGYPAAGGTRSGAAR